MAWSFLQDAMNADTGGVALATATATFSSNLTNGSVIWVGVGSLTGTTINSVTDTAGNTYNQIGSTLVNASQGYQLALFYAVNTHTTASNAIVANYGAAVQFRRCCAQEEQFAGATGYTLDTSTTATASAATSITSSSMTPTGSNDLAIQFAGQSAANDTQPGGSWTAREPATAILSTQTADQFLTTSSSVTATANSASSASGFWSIFGALIKPTVSGGFVAFSPIVVSARSKVRGRVFYRPTPPVFTAPTQRPITIPRRSPRKGFILATSKIAPAATTVITQLPIIRTRRVQRAEHIQLLNAPPPPILPQTPIVRTSTVRRRGTPPRLFTIKPPVTVITQTPLVHTNLVRRRGLAKLLPVTPVPPIITPKPLTVTNQVRRRSKIISVRPFTAPFIPKIQTPIVHTNRVFRRGLAFLARITPRNPAPPSIPACITVLDLPVNVVKLTDTPVTTLALTDSPVTVIAVTDKAC